ncbi:phytochromobilin:ferredoxin oxidoreductase, chloroplastic-like isoform X6 [Coffea arabica]|uniref:Phytochromobilin:ferredoxin oxidoreductase, chloroplastic-like isoform X6 n=1 Tax=Coffea arabica TaxID=13443 RepID=A0ABM4W4X7_COFAR
MSLSFPLYLNPSFCCNYQFVPPKSCSSSIRKSGEGGSSSSRAGSMKEASAVCYKKFIDFALEETKVHTHLATSPLQKKFNSLMSMDARTELQMLSFEAPKVRLLRCLSIEGNDGMQVLDFAVFPKPEFDLPIFCANFFTAASTNIVVLDLNPLHAVTDRDDYKEKYYRHLIPLGLKYAEAWLELMEQATEEIDTSEIVSNREAQHRYLMWRAEKDPGHRLLRRLVGEALAEEILRSFLFNGVQELGSKTFLDYFPEYRSDSGTINEKRSMIGKSFENRPWDTEGNFLGNSLRWIMAVN